MLKKFLTTGDKLGFTQSSADPCVFFKNTAKGRIIIGLYVDDTLILYDDEEEYQELLRAITGDFDYNEQAPLTDLCGIEVKETAYTCRRKGRDSQVFRPERTSAIKIPMCARCNHLRLV